MVLRLQAPACRLYRLVFSSTTVLLSFVVFVALFVFFRLICLPFLALASVGLAVKIRTFTVCYWVLVVPPAGGAAGTAFVLVCTIVKLAIRALFGGPLMTSAPRMMRKNCNDARKG
ncbi:hypothetical protein TcBrA4_0033030 [Trypanosoma cruzi]|nr:hypothetical protein TcBrA4_0033030 [Trypanosoma cruzi]